MIHWRYCEFRGIIQPVNKPEQNIADFLFYMFTWAIYSNVHSNPLMNYSYTLLLYTYSVATTDFFVLAPPMSFIFLSFLSPTETNLILDYNKQKMLMPFSS